MFGGPKSRLRSRVAPYHGGKLWVYYDPVRDSRKITDFDVHFYRTGIRELYERASCAAAVAETVLSSQGGGGNWEETTILTANTLDALDSADETASSGIAVYFFWHWAEHLGVRPIACPCELPSNGVLWYSTGKETLLCERCIREHTEAKTSFRVSAGAWHWLKEIESLHSSDLAALQLPSALPCNAEDWSAVKALSKAVLTAALGKRLSTWDGV
jgi:DNA repair protein RecO (recombination protein O)